MRVLIADERPSVRAALRAVLEHDSDCAGIDEAINSGDALAALGFGADVFVVEWGLRGLSPIPLLMQARALRPGLIIIVLGRYGDARQLALSAGADHYVDTSEPAVDFIGVLHGLCSDLRTSFKTRTSASEVTT